MEFINGVHHMTRYRFRAVLLLFLALHLTACYTWQGVATTSPAGVIEATQPDHVRVVVRGGGEMEIARPVVDGDQLVGADGVSLPVEDILALEVRNLSILRSVFAGLGIVYGVAGAILLGACASQPGAC